MKSDIILAGVGGQGILTIATIVGQAALARGLQVKQSEVHGMAQRGGAVVAHLRLSSDPIYADLIAQGTADAILSVEPMEALRYTAWLRPGGVVLANTEPVKNIPDYPDEAALRERMARPWCRDRVQKEQPPAQPLWMLRLPRIMSAAGMGSL